MHLIVSNYELYDTQYMYIVKIRIKRAKIIFFFNRTIIIVWYGYRLSDIGYLDYYLNNINT